MRPVAILTSPPRRGEVLGASLHEGLSIEAGREPGRDGRTPARAQGHADWRRDGRV